MYKKQPSTPRSQNPIIFQDKLDSKETFKYSRVPHSYFEKKFDVGATPTLPSPNQWHPPNIYIYTHHPSPEKQCPTFG